MERIANILESDIAQGLILLLVFAVSLWSII